MLKVYQLISYFLIPIILINLCFRIINKKEDKLNSFYENLRENDIKNGILLCYHYRIISNENNINVINAVKEPFFAILIFSFCGNLSVIIINIGEIPIGFIRVNKVVRQKIKNCISFCKNSYISHLLR